MKLIQAEKTFETNADFTSQDFTIGDVSVVIDILRNKLYHHKIRTLVQEYISNARDAMREAKNTTNKVEVTVPTFFEPTFKVRDYGIGIDPDRMYNVFIKYASSTKRDSNNQTGGFGIGAKSAWSYTEAFTIVTYINGIQRTYVAHIGANNNGRLDYMGEAHTDLPNGTEIQIPVKPSDTNEFKQAALRATYFWKEDEKPIFKNILKADLPQYTKGEIIGNLEINNSVPDFIATSWKRGIVISIDGIPYFIDETMINKTKSLPELTDLVTGRLILHLDNGDIEVAASREEISDSKYTLDRLNEIGAKLFVTVNLKLQKEFCTVKSPFEHLSIYMKFKDFYNLKHYRVYDKYSMNKDNGIESVLFGKTKALRCTIDSRRNTLNKFDLSKNSRRRYFNSTPTILSSEFNSLFFSDESETTLITNLRIREYLKTNKTIILFTKVPTDDGTFDILKKDLGLKDIKTIQYVKPVRQARTVATYQPDKEEFCLHRFGINGKTIWTSLALNTTNWLYVPTSTDYSLNKLEELNTYFSFRDFKVCKLSDATIKKVKKDKKFTSLNEYLQTIKPTNKDINALKSKIANNSNIINKLKKLTGIKNPIISKMINEYKSLEYYTIPQKILDLFGTIKEVESFKKDDIILERELNKYPLLNHIYFDNSVLTEITNYINSK